MYIKKIFHNGVVFCLLILLIGISISPLSEGVKIGGDSFFTNINGLYYLRGDDPLNWPDVGSLLRDLSVENESTFCGMFINFHFAQEGDYSGENKIFNIYYHLWQKGYGQEIEYEIGYSTSCEHSAGFNESIWFNINDYISEIKNYRLVQLMQITNSETAVFKGNEIYNFTIKLFGPNPNVLCNPNQYSFVILNLEDNLTLQKLDRDNDLLNDYDELFVFYTNPFDSDTDNDGYSDYSEINLDTDPNNFNDNIGPNNNPNTPIIKGPLKGKKGIEYYYNFLSADPEMDDVYYYIDWGDGQTEQWIGNYSSDEEVTLSHIWDIDGTYTIKAKAKDIYGAESDWGTLNISIPRNRIIYNPLFFKILEKLPLIKRVLSLIIYSSMV